MKYVITHPYYLGTYIGTQIPIYTYIHIHTMYIYRV